MVMAMNVAVAEMTSMAAVAIVEATSMAGADVAEATSIAATAVAAGCTNMLVVCPGSGGGGGKRGCPFFPLRAAFPPVVVVATKQ